MTARILTAAVLAGCAAAHAASPLSADELAVCANHVQQLRSESARLLERNAQLDTERERILARSRALEAAPQQTELDQRLTLHQQRTQHRDETIAFNLKIERIRAEIAALNETWRDYDARCANRPYSRRDLEQLPPAARDAMRAGLADVRVPYIPDAMPTPESAPR